MSDSAKMMVGFDTDAEQWWWVFDPSGDDDSDPYRHVVEVPAGLVERLKAADAEQDAALKAVITAAGIDPDDGRAATACDSFTYEPMPVHRWWTMVLSASDGTEWPVHDAQVGRHYDDPTAVQAAIDALPDRFWVHHPMGLVEVTRDRFSVSDRFQIGGPSRFATCERCGYDEDEHTRP